MKDLTSGSIHKNFLAFSIPIILSSILSTTLGMVDTAVAGLFLGTRGLAALGATVSFFTLLESFFFGLAYGVSVAVANSFGAKQYSRLRSIFLSNLLLTVVSVSLLSALAIPLWRPIFSFMNIDPAITEDARIYYFALCIYVIFTLVNHYCTMCSHAIGETSFPLVISLSCSVMNIVGNLLSVTVLDIGIFGLGLSTVISTAFGTLLHMLRFHRHFKKMGTHREPYRFRWEHVTSLFSYSIPNILQQSSIYVINFLTAPIYNGLGYVAVAVLSIRNRLQSVLTTVYYASARTAGNFTAQCVGAKKYHKIRPAIGVAMLQACCFFVPIMLLMWLFPEAVGSLFIDESAEVEVARYLHIYIRQFLPFLLMHMVCAVFHSIFRGIKSNRHLIVSTAISGVVNLLACLILAPICGLIGIFISSTLSWLIECVYILVVYLSGLWIPKPIRSEIIRAKKRTSDETEKTA